ncbi:YerC/YecD family TrpR-related protein [Clostridia bacterium OttesenSCG-928-F22]|nr:YerC/YecD family TrpR-related protein [Clostridia bacterium OttesenSCG-928-F22]
MANSKLKNDRMDSLFEAILLLQNEEECYAFFEDICTINELQAISQRWEVARLLEQNATYNDIAAKTGASSATISRVNRCLHYGEGGYQTILKRMK